MVTGDAFIADTDLKYRLINDYSPYCVEMEGAAIAHVCDINNVPFVIVRSISDNADDNTAIAYREFEIIASNNSAKLVITMLDLM